MEAWVDLLAAPRVDQLVILTSFHQSPLPLALMAKAAGIPQVAGISVDYPGSLLDLRHRVDDDLHEVHRALSLAEALGYRLPAGDDGRLAVDLGPDGNTGQVVPGPPYVVVHPGASVPARAWSPRRHGEAVAALVRRGRRVVVTGAPGEKDLAGAVIDRARELGTDRASVIDASGSTSLRSLAVVLRGAVAAVVGNTGPAHLAAAVGTPVVSLYAPTVPACRWHPFGVPFRLLGRQDIACAGCRAIECPRPGHPCLATVGASEVAEAVDEVTGLGDHQRRAS
jgi:ADP-heptose:LPS heptosyltransferase